MRANVARKSEAIERLARDGPRINRDNVKNLKLAYSVAIGGDLGE